MCGVWNLFLHAIVWGTRLLYRSFLWWWGDKPEVSWDAAQYSSHLQKINNSFFLNSSFISIKCVTNTQLWFCLESSYMASWLHSDGCKWDQNASGQWPLIMTLTTLHSSEGMWLQPTATELWARAVQSEDSSLKWNQCVASLYASADTNKQFTSPTPTCTGEITASCLFGWKWMTPWSGMLEIAFVFPVISQTCSNSCSLIISLSSSLRSDALQIFEHCWNIK